MNNELYEKLARLQWLFHRQHMRGYHHGGHLADATRGQGRILAALQMRDGISTKDLSYLLGLAVSSLNQFLFKLEKGGYITREPSEQDKRVILVKLTERGKAQKDQQEETQDFGDIFDCLTEKEQADLNAYLDKIIDNLGAKLGFDEEEFEWMKAAQDKRSRMFADILEHGFDLHNFRGGFGGMGGFGRGGFRGHGGGFHGRNK